MGLEFWFKSRSYNWLNLIASIRYPHFYLSDHKDDNMFFYLDIFPRYLMLYQLMITSENSFTSFV